jgi:hypothetical protein
MSKMALSKKRAISALVSDGITWDFSNRGKMALSNVA